MLTALSVARDCSMIDVNDSVIHLTVLPPGDLQRPHIEYTYTAVGKPQTTVNIPAICINLNYRYLRLSSRPHSISALWPVPNCTAW